MLQPFEDRADALSSACASAATRSSVAATARAASRNGCDAVDVLRLLPALASWMTVELR
jgi:hypothetical protein